MCPRGRDSRQPSAAGRGYHLLCQAYGSADAGHSPSEKVVTKDRPARLMVPLELLWSLTAATLKPLRMCSAPSATLERFCSQKNLPCRWGSFWQPLLARLFLFYPERGHGC